METVTGARILVVDDEPDLEVIIRHAFRHKIRQQSWHFEFAFNGAQALGMVREEEDFDVVLTDINMPIMNGLALLRELQPMDLDTRAVVISAYGDMANIRQAMQLGAIDFVTKPIDLADLDATVNKTLALVAQLKHARRIEILKAQAEAASVAKGQFLADISHELRTPLNAIVLFSELVLQELADRDLADLARDVRKIRGAGSHLMTLINDLLDFSKLEAGRLELRPETFDVGGLVHEVVDLVGEMARERGNDLQVVGADRGDSMWADPTRVRQCLLNLLSNACKFTQNGTVTLTVESPSEWVVFDVLDTGIGMTSDQLSLVFKRFEQADPTIGRTYGGTGLGLAITGHLCALMGGKIHAESTPGQGSRFTLELPVGPGFAPPKD